MPWGVIFSNPHVWLLSIQYMCLAYGWWFYINWLPTYLRDARGASFKMGALLAGLPLLLGGVGCLVSAFLVPRLTKRFGSVSIARRIIAVTGFVGASACIVIFTRIADPVQAMFVLGMAGFFNDFVMPVAWASTMDIGGRYAGTVSGAMNTMGSIAGASIGTRRGVSAGVDVRKLDADVLHLVGHLSRRGGVLAVLGFAFTGRADGDGLATAAFGQSATSPQMVNEREISARRMIPSNGREHRIGRDQHRPLPHRRIPG